MDYGILDKLAIQYNTDKRSSKHGYTRYYEFYFNSIRNNIKKILEIGIWKGSSLKMWKDYFPNSVIHGIDIIPECFQYKEDRVEVSIGNFNEPNFVSSFIKQYGGDFDLIIEDASHLNKDQISAFKIFFPYLKSKGMYVVEDANTSYFKEYGGGYKKPDTSVEFFKERIDDVFLKGFRRKRRDCYSNRDAKLKAKEFTEYEKSIESIHFYSGLIILFKQ